MAGLRQAGWSIEVITLDPSSTTSGARAEAARRLAEIDTGARVLIDGLALGVIPALSPDLLRAHRQRLHLIALVHHPLADETGISPAEAAGLQQREHAALAAVHQIVVTSAATARRLAALDADPGKIAVIEPGTDPAPLAERAGRPPLRLLCVGAVIPRKGHRFLVEALAPLPKRLWRLRIVGSLDRDAATAAQLHGQLQSLGLQDRIELSGALSETALEQAYQEADLFVLPSLYEGYGMAFAEALARGLPILGSGAGAVAETVPAMAGLLVAPGSSQALAKALARLLHQPAQLAPLAAGAEQARRRLPDWPAQIRRWDLLLAHV